jgi:hypothetical protein
VLWWFQPGKPPPLVLDVQRQKRDGFEDGLRLRLRGVVDEPLGAGAPAISTRALIESAPR